MFDLFHTLVFFSLRRSLRHLDGLYSAATIEAKEMRHFVSVGILRARFDVGVRQTTVSDTHLEREVHGVRQTGRQEKKEDDEQAGNELCY